MKSIFKAATAGRESSHSARESRKPRALEAGRTHTGFLIRLGDKAERKNSMVKLKVLIFMLHEKCYGALCTSRRLVGSDEGSAAKALRELPSGATVKLAQESFGRVAVCL